jgi:N,N'-diacetylchitobiose transport system permease protein
MARTGRREVAAEAVETRPAPASPGTAGAAVPAGAAVTPGTGTLPPAQPAGRRLRRGIALPYLLILPSVIAFIALLGYPLYQVAKISFQKLDLAELVQRRTVYVGFANWQRILSDPFFWRVTLRTVLFTAACVALTMVIGTLIALLLDRVGKRVRLLLSIGLVMAWATPPVTAVTVWQWLFDTQFGVVNWLLTTAGLGDFTNHSWFATGLSTFGVIVAIIVWGAVPFVAFTLYAGITAVPHEWREAMRVDGAGPFRVFRSLLFPVLKPLFLITGFLSIIWDFKVFTQVWLVRQGGPDRQTITLVIYAYQQGIATSRFGPAAAISLAMVLLLLAFLVYYLRLMLRTQEDL